MRLVHFADTHLGFKAYHTRVTRLGINQREADVARTFARVVDQTIALDPELVVIGGDIFHHVRPSNTAQLAAQQQFRRLREALPHTEIVMVAGNHDTPRESGIGNPLHLLGFLGLHIVDGAAREIDLPAIDCCVLAVPDSWHARPPLLPTNGRKYNVLLMHGDTGGISKTKELRSKEIQSDEMHPSEWQYIALGHYHVMREILPNAYYSGSIDYTSTDVWGEQREQLTRGIPGKGIIERDLESGAHTFHPLPASRELVEFEPISAFMRPAADVMDELHARVDDLPEGVNGKIVRVRITDLERTEKRQLDWKYINRLKKLALDFNPICEAPESIHAGTHALVRNRAPLDQIFAQYLREKHVLPDDVNREEFVALGQDYFEQATEKERAAGTATAIAHESAA